MTNLKARCLGGLKAAIAATSLVAVTAAPALAQSLGKFVVTEMAEKTVSELPEGELYWHVETFASLDAAKAAGGEFSLATEFDDKAWLFTLADRKAGAMGGTPVASVGPVPRFDAPEYLLRINSATAPVGAKTSIHSHPGPECFLILSGQLTQRTPYGQHVLNAGGTMPGVPNQAMEVLSTGDEEGRVAKLVEIRWRGSEGMVVAFRRRGQGRWVSGRGSASHRPGAW